MQFIRLNRLSILVFAACVGLLGYFYYQAMLGPRSIKYREELVDKLTKSLEISSTLTSQRGEMEARVQMMRPESIDSDLADEFARKAASLGKEGDIVVIFNR